MITFVRSVKIAPGKLAEIIAFSHQVVKHVKDKHGVQIQLTMPIGGNPNRIGYVTTYPNLAEFEAASTKLAADADYQKLVAANAANTIPGSVHDELWRSI
jgi:hypothetical protein